MVFHRYPCSRPFLSCCNIRSHSRHNCNISFLFSFFIFSLLDTDCGFLTILTQNLPGLEVQDPQTNQWKSVKPLEDAFVVNLGDMAARWTNDAYKSTKHRVYNKTDFTRYSVPFFCNCNFDAPVKCIVNNDNKNKNSRGEVDVEVEVEGATNNKDDGGLIAGETMGAKYEPTTAGAYILERLGLMRLVK